LQSVKPKNRPGHVNITLVITAVDCSTHCCQFSLYNTGTSLFFNDQVFQILDSLHPTATGLDQLPAWFPRLGAPLFCEPIARLFNLSLNTSTIPTQWKLASIQPVPKLPDADFRPISITPVLPHHGTNSRPALPLSSLPLSCTKPVVHRPVRFPSDWIPNSCNNLSSQHRHQPTSNQPLRHRHIPGLKQGV